MLNPALDPAAFAQRFAMERRLQIRGIFAPEAAERIHTCLSRETPWSLLYNDGEKIARLSPEQLRAMPAPEKSARATGVLQRARGAFQYVYNSYQTVESYLARKDPGLFLHTVYEYCNSPEMLDFLRAATGIPELLKCDSQATLYAPGHFLKAHDDDVNERSHRRIAYVLGFAKDWDPDWGGILQFYDQEHNVTHAMVPRFNVLSIFSVPQFHAVSYVVPYAPIGRYSITGWYVDK